MSWENAEARQRLGGAREQLPADDELLLRAVADCRAALGATVADELGELPERQLLDGTLYCHASPVSDMRSFMPKPGDDDELLTGVTEARVVFGHTHLQFRRHSAAGVELVNPGSVGLPLDGDSRAAYALVADDGSIEFRRVQYNVAAAIEGLNNQFGDLPWTARSIMRLRTARF